MSSFLTRFVAIGFAASLIGSTASAATTAEAVQAIRAVGGEGRGNTDASVAMRELSKAQARELATILSGMDGASPLALNWLRSAAETIVARETAAGRQLPVAELETFVGQTSHHPRARRLAYELIAQTDPARADTLIAGMLDDPSTELRRDAVQRVVDEAARSRAAKNDAAAVASYQQALKSARDVDQVQAISKALSELGQPVSLPEVFGWVKDWRVIGPFDNTAGAGYDTVFPPEENLDFAAEYQGKTGKAGWKSVTTTNDLGMVDLNKSFGALKEVTGYAVTEIQSDTARAVELRLGCKNGWKLWLNGDLLFGRDEYHRGTEIDHYRLKANLKPGKNVILVKLTQNEMKEEWTVEWEFQLRITDDLGTPIKFAKN